MPLIFPNPIPGMPNTGVQYQPPAVLQLIEGLQARLKTLQASVDNLDPDTVRTEIDGLLASVEAITGDIEALQLAVSGKEDAANKTGTISQSETEYPNSKAVYDALLSLGESIGELSNQVAEKANGNSTGAAVRAVSIPFAQCDSTSTNLAFTATVPGITALEPGTCFILKNGVVTSKANCTLNINGLGALPIYYNMAAASRVTTHYNINYTWLFVYDNVIVTTGCWLAYWGYYSDSNSVGYNLRYGQQVGAMKSALYRYQFVFTNRAGELIPANSYSNNVTVTKALTTEAWDPRLGIYYYSTSGTVAAGSMPSASYMYYQHNGANMRYGFNCSTTALTAYEPVYIKCSPQADGTVKLSGNDCLVQDLPAAADGYVYLLLGYAYSGYQINLTDRHPVYYNDGNNIVPWIS